MAEEKKKLPQITIVVLIFAREQNVLFFSGLITVGYS